MSSAELARDDSLACGIGRCALDTTCSPGLRVYECVAYAKDVMDRDAGINVRVFGVWALQLLV
jgi:hypothetical protein